MCIRDSGKATLQGPSSHTAPFHADFPQDLTPGKNVIAIGSLAVRNFRGTGGRNAIAAHGVIDLQGGTRVEFNTDNNWKATVLAAPAGRGRGAAAPDTTAQWYGADFDDSSWPAATVLGPYSATAVARSADPTIGPCLLYTSRCV